MELTLVDPFPSYVLTVEFLCGHRVSRQEISASVVWHRCDFMWVRVNWADLEADHA